MKVRFVDPPSGWMYGFPCELPEGKSYKELLIEHRYPTKDIPFALNCSRWWEEERKDK